MFKLFSYICPRIHYSLSEMVVIILMLSKIMKKIAVVKFSDDSKYYYHVVKFCKRFEEAFDLASQFNDIAKELHQTANYGVINFSDHHLLR